ncbi:hypothetical protein MIND_01360900 [Mycena indigotica]|uniref:HCP-like protein n=1 Tax=Mycena indigotica TaxID=2126181 RepID=A0A8H6RY19_9AGAR|nr:uncharacterized protein MIND_01360900 [Mycena indigotica]KAF7289865.1 hypothetical protein MIND_01360900 [Mycena indigotica]
MTCDLSLFLWGWCWDWDDNADDENLQMARDLDATFMNPNPTRATPSPMPPPQGSDWSPWAPAAGIHAVQARTPSPMPPRLPSPPRDGSLTVPLPSISALTAAMSTVTSPNHDPQLQLAWARDVMFLVDRTPSLSTSPLALAAVPLLLTLASTHNLPEALFLRATFASSGAYPNFIPQNPRAAFRDFETAARAGYSAAWFRLARDYEQFNDTTHALDCLNRGAKARDPAALHRLGTAHLLAQLGLSTDLNTALPYLHQAACRASLQCPQPAYVFALILLGEFTAASVPLPSLVQFLPPGQSHEVYAKAMLERAAGLHFAPAQYKLGHAFEFAVPPSAFPFDPLLSVQWYSLASQAGEAEADMALSKWFLCGAEGAFEKDESLARTFATKAAAKGLPSGEFAMGYYCEVGIGAPKDVAEARDWYSKAAGHGNSDAPERLKALQQPTPQTLGRSEHDALTENKLVRKRTQARIRSEGVGGGMPGGLTSEPESFSNPHPEMPDPYGVGRGRGQASGQGPPSAYRPQQGPPPPDRRTRVMELARKSSIAEGPGPGAHYRMGSAGGFDYRQGGAGQGGYGSPAPVGPGQVYGSPNSRPKPLPGQGSGRMPQAQPQQQQRLHPREGSLPPQQQPPSRPGTGAGRGFALNDPGNGNRPTSAAGSIASTNGRLAGTPPLRRPGTANSGAPPANQNGNGKQNPSQNGDTSGFITTKTGGGGPATFAEMGFTGAKAEDKECVIM